MEPMNCTADVQADSCDVYVPTQGQTASQQAAMAASELPADKVKIHATYMGGGFGRRGEADFVIDAVETSKAVGKPVKVVWTREDDMQHDYYRPVSYARMWGAVDAQRQADGVHAAPRAAVADEAHRRAAAERRRLHLARRRREPAVRHPERPDRVHRARSRHSVRLLAIGRRLVPGLRRSRRSSTSWRRPRGRIRISSDAICWARRRAIEAALDLAAEKAGWGKPLPQGRGRGIAVMECFGSILARSPRSR